MRRACRRSARMRARVLLPTRKGPSMTMKRGGWGLRCGMRARLAAEESSLGIVGLDRKRSAADGRIIAELRQEFWRDCRGWGRMGEPKYVERFFTFMA